MKLWVALVCFCVNAAAQNPYPPLYGAIGDKVYAAAEGYGALADKAAFEENRVALNLFVKKADRLKREGFLLSESATKGQRSAYIASLRSMFEEKKSLDHAVLQQISRLKAAGKRAELLALSENPYALIRNAAYVAPVTPAKKTEKSAAAEMPEDLWQSLAELKEKLLGARNQKSPDMQCLNDVTAMNYWMAEAEEQKAGRAWCKAHDACEQIISFERAARKSCSKEHPLYERWRAYSVEYRTTLKKELSRMCY